MMFSNWTKAALAATLAMLLAGCATPMPGLQRAGTTNAPPMPVIQAESLEDADEQPRAQVRHGSGQTINQAAASAPRPGLAASSGESTFNFEGAPLHAVVKAILGDMLGQNYVIAPEVQGTVTLATPRPVGAAGALGMLEMVLGWNNARMIYSGGRYNIVPAEGAVATGTVSPRVGDTAGARGFEVRTVPLRYISATEMEKVLEPYARPDAIVSADNARNVITIAGTRTELDNYLRTIEIFDVDWLAGMSVGVFPLESGRASEVVSDLETVFGEDSGSPVAGMFRFMPLDGANAIMVITAQPAYLAEVQRWYKGYLFGGQVMYNPWSVMCFLDDAENKARPHWVSTSGNELIKRLLEQHAGQLQPLFVELLSGGGVEQDGGVGALHCRRVRDETGENSVARGVERRHRVGRSPKGRRRHAFHALTPAAVRRACSGGRYDAAVAVGAFIRGETPHFDFVAGEASRALQQVVADYEIPVGFGLLTTDTLEQAAAFVRMAGEGVRVRILTNSLAANDVVAVHGGYANYRKDLLRTGVNLYEMRPQVTQSDASLFGSSGASLHTKAFVVDDRYGFVGSFNIDPRSIDLNTEMGVLFDDVPLALALREEYLRLSGDGKSYWVYLNEDEELRWLDRADEPPVVLDHEPESGLATRLLARLVGWLPVESQL